MLSRNEKSSGARWVVMIGIAVVVLLLVLLVALFWRSAWWKESGPPPYESRRPGVQPAFVITA